MRLWISVCILLGLLVLGGCSNPVTFAGSSPFWTVECCVDPSGKHKSYVIEYVGDGRETPGNVSYAFAESSNFQSQGTAKGPSKHLKITGSSTSGSDATYVEEEGFKLIMKWNGREEMIQLHKQ
ncbi:hypothetical protein [Paenibacillus thalictri]|uniref:Lipoprotein n=1 Tax=Paenibacillus thalictri TaxID=2527873 RepID=A0A4Q9DD26_9BACL|nr:hypothetical protein [Paenibacillus thalictri]TBL68609.1 hypothetical protein EYB31_37655 [Paenibacillus thalictri]